MNKFFKSPIAFATIECICALITVYLYRLWRHTDQAQIAWIACLFAIGLATALIKNHAYGHSAILATFAGIHPMMDWTCVGIILLIYIFRLAKPSLPKE